MAECNKNKHCVRKRPTKFCQQGYLSSQCSLYGRSFRWVILILQIYCSNALILAAEKTLWHRKNWTWHTVLFSYLRIWFFRQGWIFFWPILGWKYCCEDLRAQRNANASCRNVVSIEISYGLSCCCLCDKGVFSFREGTKFRRFSFNICM